MLRWADKAKQKSEYKGESVVNFVTVFLKFLGSTVKAGHLQT